MTLDEIGIPNLRTWVNEGKRAVDICFSTYPGKGVETVWLYDYEYMSGIYLSETDHLPTAEELIHQKRLALDLEMKKLEEK